jgi:hypothetical protein
MAQSPISASQLSDEAVKARFKAAFRRRVGVGKPWSVEMLADEAAIPARDLRSYQDLGGCLPTLPRFLALCIVFGGDFANEVLSVAGFDGARPVAGADGDPFGAQQALAGGLYQLANDLADGKFDHREAAAALPVMRQVHEKLGLFIAGLSIRVEG